MSTYWDKASQEQRLAQIDGGIECGMTSKQIAMCLGAPIYETGNAVISYGNRHGRVFTTPREESRAKGLKRGGPIGNIVRNRQQRLPETFNKDAFSIFSTHDEPNPFNALLPEEVE